MSRAQPDPAARDKRAARPPGDAQTEAAIAALIRGEHGEPFALLGAHPVPQGWAVRTFVPGAETASLRDATGHQTPLACLHPDGMFGALLPDHPGRYRIAARRGEDAWQITDPWQFGPVLGAMDEHLISEGAHLRLWRTLGARPISHEGAEGVVFAVWAPAARRVSVIGDFNDWDGRRHPMRRRGATGVWELFIPDLTPGLRYKYEIAPPDGGLPFPKSDPVGFQAEMRPGNCSVIAPREAHDWRDGDWLRDRAARQRLDAPISIYEVHLGSWRRHADSRWLTYRDLATDLVPYVRDLGFTHLEVLPISEHPLDASWGYQPVGLYAPTSRFGTPDDFRALVDACHAAGLGLIIDWVPAHFPSDPHGLGKFDGTALYEHADPREGYHPDWNTLIYNLGRREVGNFLIANALYWLREFHVDALRVDAVASMLYRDYSRKDGEWLPNRHGGRENLEAIDFLRRLNATAYGEDPGIMMIAEESTAWPGVSRPVHDGGLGFGYKWNMGWMHDTLDYMQRDPIHRAHHHGQMTQGLGYAFSENFILSLSHDEVVHGKGSLYGKMPGDHAAKLANLRAYYAFMWAHPGKKLLFMGQEFGQPGEWSEEAQLDWAVLGDPGHAGLRDLVRDLNGLYRALPALHRRDCRGDGFAWIDGAAAQDNVLAWLRLGDDGAPQVLAVFNFAARAHHDWRLGVPRAGRWRQVLDTDAPRYGGTGQGNPEVLDTRPDPRHGHAQSLALTLPPLSGVYFLHEGV